MGLNSLGSIGKLETALMVTTGHKKADPITEVAGTIVEEAHSRVDENDVLDPRRACAAKVLLPNVPAVGMMHS